ncbi:MAG: hypothetical protein ACJ76H_00830 [Bacteriovoracaceae bacterium]
MKQLICLLSSLLILFSCSSSPKDSNDNHFKVVEKVFDMFKGLQKSVEGGDSSELSVAKAHLKNQSRIAVYFVPPEKNTNWKWGYKEKELFLHSLESNKKTEKAFELIGLDNKSVDPGTLRTLAAQQGADALLLVRGSPNVQSHLNGKAFTYLLVIPTLFVNGNDVESTFTSQAVLWDVRKPFVHLGVESEGEWEMERPLAFRQKDRGLAKAKESSLMTLSRKINSQLDHL